MKAFPHIAKAHILDGNQIIAEEITSGGMELRDYFAARAMVALVPIYREMFMDNIFEDWYGDAVSDMVTGAYEIADAMMKEREGK
jgi:hypothetical protein